LFKDEEFKREKLKREELKRKFPELFHGISEILFEHDLMGINFGTNTDEYEPEVGTIIPELQKCSDHKDVQRVICQNFVYWFGDEACKKESDYEDVAKGVWRVWVSHLAVKSPPKWGEHEN